MKRGKIFDFPKVDIVPPPRNKLYDSVLETIVSSPDPYSPTVDSPVPIYQDSPLSSLAINFASNAFLSSPSRDFPEIGLQAKKLTFDASEDVNSSDEHGGATPVKRTLSSELKEAAEVVKNKENEGEVDNAAKIIQRKISTDMQRKTSTEERVRKTSDLEKRRKISRPRSGLMEVTNIVGSLGEEGGCRSRKMSSYAEDPLQVLIGLSSSPGAEWTAIASPSPLGKGAPETHPDSVFTCDTIAEVSDDDAAKNEVSKAYKLQNSKRALSFEKKGRHCSSRDQPVSCFMSAAARLGDFDSSFEDIHEELFQPSPEFYPPTTTSSTFSSLLTAPIIKDVTQDNNEKDEHNFCGIKRIKAMTDSARKDPPCKRFKLNPSPVVVSQAVPRNSPLPIGDKSANHVLPLVNHRRMMMASIAPDTLVKLLDGKFDNVVEWKLIIDCRYPYEYEGGHIKDAVNLWSKQLCLDKLFEHEEDGDHVTTMPKAIKKRKIIIFHCEFSSQRAPKMYEFVREVDRRRNCGHYPRLHYPEMYLLHAGYREFFHLFKNYCTPQGYVEMTDEAFKDQLREYKMRCKTEDTQMRLTFFTGRSGKVLPRSSTSQL